MIMLPRRISAPLLAVFFSCSCALAQDNAPAPVPARSMLTPAPTGEVSPPPAGPIPTAPELTLETCIARALQKNFDLEIGRYNPQIAKDAIAVAGAAYEPQLSVTGSHGRSVSESSTSSSTDFTPAGTSTTSDLRVGATQQFYTGTTLSASSKLDRSALDPAVSATNPAYNADLTLSVRQSLLRGLGTEVNRAAVHRAEIGFQRANLDFKTAALTVIQSTESAYYNLAFAR